MGDLSE